MIKAAAVNTVFRTFATQVIPQSNTYPKCSASEHIPYRVIRELNSAYILFEFPKIHLGGETG